MLSAKCHSPKTTRNSDWPDRHGNDYCYSGFNKASPDVASSHKAQLAPTVKSRLVLIGSCYLLVV